MCVVYFWIIENLIFLSDQYYTTLISSLGAAVVREVSEQLQSQVSPPNLLIWPKLAEFRLEVVAVYTVYTVYTLCTLCKHTVQNIEQIVKGPYFTVTLLLQMNCKKSIFYIKVIWSYC